VASTPLHRHPLLASIVHPSITLRIPASFVGQYFRVQLGAGGARVLAALAACKPLSPGVGEGACARKPLPGWRAPCARTALEPAGPAAASLAAWCTAALAEHSLGAGTTSGCGCFNEEHPNTSSALCAEQMNHAFHVDDGPMARKEIIEKGPTGGGGMEQQRGPNNRGALMHNTLGACARHGMLMAPCEKGRNRKRAHWGKGG